MSIHHLMARVYIENRIPKSFQSSELLIKLHFYITKLTLNWIPLHSKVQPWKKLMSVCHLIAQIHQKTIFKLTLSWIPITVIWKSKPWSIRIRKGLAYNSLHLFHLFSTFTDLIPNTKINPNSRNIFQEIGMLGISSEIAENWLTIS